MKEQHFITRKEILRIPEYSSYSYNGIVAMYNRFLKKVGKAVGKRLNLTIEEFARCSHLPVEYITQNIQISKTTKNYQKV